MQSMQYNQLQKMTYWSHEKKDVKENWRNNIVEEEKKVRGGSQERVVLVQRSHGAEERKGRENYREEREQKTSEIKD